MRHPFALSRSICSSLDRRAFHHSDHSVLSDFHPVLRHRRRNRSRLWGGLRDFSRSRSRPLPDFPMSNRTSSARRAHGRVGLRHPSAMCCSRRRLPVLLAGLRIGFFICFASVLGGETLVLGGGRRPQHRADCRADGIGAHVCLDHLRRDRPRSARTCCCRHRAACQRHAADAAAMLTARQSAACMPVGLCSRVRGARSHRARVVVCAGNLWAAGSPIRRSCSRRARLCARWFATVLPRSRAHVRARHGGAGDRQRLCAGGRVGVVVGFAIGWTQPVRRGVLADPVAALRDPAGLFCCRSSS